MEYCGSTGQLPGVGMSNVGAARQRNSSMRTQQSPCRMKEKLWGKK